MRVWALSDDESLLRTSDRCVDGVALADELVKPEGEDAEAAVGSGDLVSLKQPSLDRLDTCGLVSTGEAGELLGGPLGTGDRTRDDSNQSVVRFLDTERRFDPGGER